MRFLFYRRPGFLERRRDLIDRLITLALERHGEKQQLRTSVLWPLLQPIVERYH